MDYIGQIITNLTKVKDFCTEINSATLTGAIDVVIVKQPDGTYLCSPFHVRFGKIDVLHSKEKIVDIEINDEPVEIFMKLGHNGEAFFVEERTEDNENSNSTTRVMCKKIEVEKMKKFDENETNLAEHHLAKEHDEDSLNDQLNELTFGTTNPSITRTKSIQIGDHEIYPYSDGECTPFTSHCPTTEFDRPSSPKSDTEYEITRSDSKKADAGVSWQWGELPHLSRSVHTKTPDQGAKENELIDMDPKTPESVLGSSPPDTAGVLKNVKNELQALKERKGFREEGIYLDEINPENLDPEVAELYFPKLRSIVPLKKVSDDETESGKGLSLPSNSPQRESSPISDLDEKDDLINVVVENNLVNRRLDEQLKTEQIQEQQIQEQPIQDQQIQDEQTLRAHSEPADELPGGQSNEPQIEAAQSSTSPIVDLSAISKDYSDLAISLCGGSNSLDGEIDDEKFSKFLVTFDKFAEDSIAILQNQNLVVRLKGKYFNFQIASSFLMSLLLYRKELPAEQFTRLVEQQQLLNSKKKVLSSRSPWWPWRRSHSGYSEKSSQPKNADNLAINLAKEKFKPVEDGNETDSDDLAENRRSHHKHKSNYKKMLRLGSKDIEHLVEDGSLHEGMNTVQFNVTTAYQGTSRCNCRVYLWNYNDKIIISDIDGTITKSDVLGHILPRIGHDWAQSGVANLFTKIKENGYKVLYLSARAIGQAEGTREYLKSVKQGELCLPDGPLLLSPTSLLSAFHREVIEKKPEEFKISCLKDIQALFPSNPFYAGFGNKINVSFVFLVHYLVVYRRLVPNRSSPTSIT